MNTEVSQLDALTGGAFTAATSSERAALIRAWMESDPVPEHLQAVFKEMSVRDKGAAKPLRERLDEMRRAKTQEGMVAEWQVKGQALLDLSRMNMADAMAWQRDAAKAGAPLSKEPLLTLKLALAARVEEIEQLQHQIGVQKESSAMMTQRLDSLTTKPLQEAQSAQEVLASDFTAWMTRTEQLKASPAWAHIDAKLPPALQNCEQQSKVLWQSFSAVLEQALTAMAAPDAPLPTIPVWADEIRVHRGSALAVSKPAPSGKPKVDPEKRQAAHDAIAPILAKLEEELAQGHGKASSGAASNLRQALKEYGAWIDGKLDLACHAALAGAGEMEGWQRWRADQLRQQLLQQAVQIAKEPLPGRKQQDTIRSLRDQWKQADQGGIPNHGLWKRFDEACNEAHKVVEVWLEEIKAKSAAVIAQRHAMLEELKTWSEAHATSTDWKAISRQLHSFGDRWREAGHLSERDFEPLQTAWKNQIKTAAAPLDAAQKSSLAARQALIAQAKALADKAAQGGDLRIDAVRALQQQWQQESQSVPLERKQEQKLWDAFKSTIDGAFAAKDKARQAARDAHLASLSAHDKAVLEASKALEAANAGGNAATIQAAIAVLQAALRGQSHAKAEQASAPAAQPAVATAQVAAQASEHAAVATDSASEAVAADSASGAVTADAASGAASPPDPAAATDAASGTDLASAPTTAAAPSPTAPVLKVAKPVIAMRSDDRKSAKAPEPSKFGKKPGFGSENQAGRGFGAKDGRPAREDVRPDRGPRLSDDAFHAQRKAMEQAEFALKKLQMQAHGEVVTAILSAWQARAADQLPAASALGKAVNNATRTQWAQALGKADAKDESGTALLRLEMATGVPTPADFLNDRRALQLQLLTKRNEPAPSQTWAADVAKVLASDHTDVAAKRLQANLKALLKA